MRPAARWTRLVSSPVLTSQLELGKSFFEASRMIMPNSFKASRIEYSLRLETMGILSLAASTSSRRSSYPSSSWDHAQPSLVKVGPFGTGQ